VWSKSRMIPLLLVLLLVALLSVTPALAGPKGNGHRANGGATTATMAVQPNPVAAWGAEYTVSGTGFQAGTPVSIVLSEPFCCSFFTVTADANGNIWLRSTTGQPGTYKIEAYQRPNGKRLTLMATTGFSVVEP